MRSKETEDKDLIVPVSKKSDFNEHYSVVTGCAGFIGSHLTEILLKQGVPILGIDNFDRFYERSLKEENLRILQKTARDHNTPFEFLDTDCCDLRNFRGKKINKVYHFAGRGGVRPSMEFPEEYLKINLTATARILEVCREQKIRNFIFISSSSVYGNDTLTPFAVDARADRPVSPYAATKRAAELLCYNYSHLFEIRVAVLRLFTVYGPRQRPDLAIYKFANLILDSQPLPIFGNGSSSRDYTFVSDIVDGTIKAGQFLENSVHPTYEIFNLGNSTPVSLLEMVKLLENALDKKALLKHLDFQQGDVERTFADITKTQEKLGYQPKISLESGISQFVQWLKTSRRSRF